MAGASLVCAKHILPSAQCHATLHVFPPPPQWQASSDSNPTLHRQNSPLTLSWSQERALQLKKWGHTRPKAGKSWARVGRGRGRGGGAASGCATLSSPHSSSLACSAPAARPPPCGWPAGHKVRQGWTAPALISGVPSFLQLPGSPEICKVCPRWCLQSAPTCPKVFPNLERAGKGGGMGRAEVCRQRVRVSP